MAEWLKATDCRSVDRKVYVGSNPILFTKAGIVEWFNISLPSLRRQFDSDYPLQRIY